MEKLGVLLFGLFTLIALHLAFRGAGRGLGRLLFSLSRTPLIRILTPYYRKKAVQKLQKERKAQGLPPLENPDAL
jgi:hypothetical protein